HVDDVASGILGVLGAAKGEDVNICSGQPTAVRDVLRLIARTIGREDLLALGARPAPNWDPPFLCGDNARLRSYGWLPKFSLEAGIADAVGWWRQRI
ncbi:MAG TPA: NAD(P)-dependent oxidoreductase, partial [Polyangia bacterium]